MRSAAVALALTGAAAKTDLYQCNAAKLASEGLCYMESNSGGSATPHDIDRAVAADGFRVVADSGGSPLSLAPKPWTEGDQLVESSSKLSGDILIFSELFEIMAPLRDAMMYYPKTIVDDKGQWTKLTKAFKDCGVKAADSEDTEHGGTIYGVDGIYNHLKTTTDNHHEIMRFLEEAAIDVVCLATSLDGSFCRTQGESKPDCWKDAYKGMYGTDPLSLSSDVVV